MAPFVRLAAKVTLHQRADVLAGTAGHSDDRARLGSNTSNGTSLCLAAKIHCLRSVSSAIGSPPYRSDCWVFTLLTRHATSSEAIMIPSFGGRLRDELLAIEAFNTLLEAQVLVEDWRIGLGPIA
jgi:hypothetical protein